MLTVTSLLPIFGSLPLTPVILNGTRNKNEVSTTFLLPFLWWCCSGKPKNEKTPNVRIGSGHVTGAAMVEVVVALFNVDLEGRFMIADEPKLRCLESRLKHHILERGPCAEAMLSIVELGQSERIACGSCQSRLSSRRAHSKLTVVGFRFELRVMVLNALRSNLP